MGGGIGGWGRGAVDSEEGDSGERALGVVGGEERVEVVLANEFGVAVGECDHARMHGEYILGVGDDDSSGRSEF